MLLAKNDDTCVIEDNPECPFKMWNLYFPKESKCIIFFKFKIKTKIKLSLLNLKRV